MQAAMCLLAHHHVYNHLTSLGKIIGSDAINIVNMKYKLIFTLCNKNVGSLISDAVKVICDNGNA